LASTLLALEIDWRVGRYQPGVIANEFLASQKGNDE
jgi:hypothetical protein